MTNKDIRDRLLGLFGTACAFRMLKVDSKDHEAEIQAAKETGLQLETGLKQLLAEISSTNRTDHNMNKIQFLNKLDNIHSNIGYVITAMDNEGSDFPPEYKRLLQAARSIIFEVTSLADTPEKEPTP